MTKEEKRKCKKRDRGIVDFMMVTSLIRGETVSQEPASWKILAGNI